MSEFRDFLELPYAELEDLNLQAKEQRRKRVAIDVIQEERLKYLTDERRIKAVTVLFQRPRRPAAHAGLRQEVPDKEL